MLSNPFLRIGCLITNLQVGRVTPCAPPPQSKPDAHGVTRPTTKAWSSDSARGFFQVIFFLAFLCVAVMANSQTEVKKFSAEELKARQQRTQALVNDAVRFTLERFADQKLATNQLAVTLAEFLDPQTMVMGSYRGDAQIYPASVVKLFYLGAMHRWLEDGKLQDSEELRRALRDMIVDSYNEATHYIVDLLTDTTSGPELSPAEMEKWIYKRNAVNRYFSSLAYTNINVNRKPWCEGPYGREKQSVKMHQPNRNLLTTDDTARLLLEIVTGMAVTRERSAEMMLLLARDPFSKSTDPDDQAHGFTGRALPPGAKLWSKAGWTSETRHDAAYVELPGGVRFVLVTFTTGHANEREIIPTVAKKIIEGLTK